MFFCIPGRILIGPGVRHELPALLVRLGWKRAAVVTDRFFAAPAGAATELVQALQREGVQCTLFDGGEPDPSLALCDAACEQLRAQGPVDGVIAVGGGSNIDLAKALTLTLVSGQPTASYVATKQLPHAPLPLVALPTTAGTASEITPGAILVAGDGETKVAVMDNELRARIAVIDPELTLSCPPRVTADAGIDALTHAIESYITMDAGEFDREGHCDPGYSGRNVLTRMFAREAIRLCFEHLATAWREPANLAARNGMALASLYAGLSYCNAGLNAVHALAYGVAALTHETHGSTNAVMLPYVMAELADERREDLCDIAQLAGAAATSPPTRQAALQAAHRVRELIASVGLATRLGDMGVAEQDLGPLAQAGLGVARLTKAFPGGAAAGRYAAIVEAAFHGRLEGAGR